MKRRQDRGPAVRQLLVMYRSRMKLLEEIIANSDYAHEGIRLADDLHLQTLKKIVTDLEDLQTLH